MMMATATTTTTTSSSKVCVNAKCCSTSSPNWKPGWLMRSGRIADLCDSCGLAYEQLRFCETFHSDDAGWRTCNSCKKRVHCGCIASIYSFILLDTGGVECINCAKSSSGPGTAPDSNKNFLSPTGLPHKISDSSVEGWSRSRLPWTVDSGTWLPFPIPWLPSTTQTGAPHWGQLPETYRPVESDRVAENSTGEMTSAADSNKAEDSNDKIQGGSTKVEKSVSGHTVSTKLVDGKKQEEDITKADTLDGDAKDLTDSGSGKELLSQGGLTQKMDESAVQDMGILDRQAKPMLENVGELDESTSLPASKGADSDTDQLEQSTGACLTMSLGLFPSKEVANEVNEQAGLNTPISFTGNTGLEGRDHVKLSGLSSIRHRQRQLLPKPPQSQPPARSETPKESASQAPIRVARPPGEGRGRNQLLPRYWPRITDQELQQITSGDSNSTITPLFEKMLSASDAGRIGRLVLPKACAEAYFPPISQPEGLPLRIQDVSGKEWVFQFRFWPNNNSRMYVLEGVTPCIQSMQLQAGDTVTFSRLDPEGKLVMGYRRAPSSLSSQENQPSPAGTASTAATPLTSGGIDSLSVIANLSGLLPPSLKCGSEAQLSGLSGQFNMSETGYGWFKNEKTGNKPKEGSFLHSLISVDKRRGRHLGTKSKRLRMEVEDSIELELSWEEAQDLLRPPPDVAPSIVTIEGHEFEEYEEPPVFGKRTIFTTRQTGPGEDQWAQCDDCGSWRKVPSDVFLPTRWTCADNVWDTRRTSCTSPQEVNSQEIENLLRVTKDVKKPESIEGPKVKETSSGLEALANAATLGENNTASSSPAPTTKHPRHRPGCTCIVCIQPPSGKGPKHKPTCVCNVCMTVKRRFKTLMMRRKKRQSEREAENARKKRAWGKEEGEVNSGTKWRNDSHPFPENGSRQGNLAVTFPSSLPRMNSFSSNGNRFPPNVTFTGSYPSRARAGGEECLGNKGNIDLNSQPEREDEPGKGTGRVSMVRLVQNASYPLDVYLKQQGLASLICPQQMLFSSMGFTRNIGGGRIDEQLGTQHAVVTSDRPQEEATFAFERAKGDDATASAQSFELLERKSSAQVSSQSS